MAKIAISNNWFNVSKNGDQFSINDKDVDYDLMALPNGQFHLILDKQSYTIEVVSKNPDTGNLTIKINGRKVDTQLQNKLTELLKSMGMESGKKKLKELKAPMPGLVLEVKVAPGDSVVEGQDLLVLEAMKMENAIKSPQDGIIESVSVSKQDKVEKNHVLVTFQ